jgi:hypothetical protein
MLNSTFSAGANGFISEGLIAFLDIFAILPVIVFLQQRQLFLNVHYQSSCFLINPFNVQRSRFKVQGSRFKVMPT